MSDLSDLNKESSSSKKDSVIFILFLVAICLFFDNTRVIDKILQNIGYIIGGGGIAAYIVSRQHANNPSLPGIEIEE